MCSTAERRRTDVVRIELIHSSENADCSSAESPCHYRAENRELTLVEIVHEHSIKLTSHSNEPNEVKRRMKMRTPM
jgi:hypothetical protein